MALVLALAVPASAGWVMVDKDGETTLLSEGRLKSLSGGGGMVLDGPASRMTVIDDRQRLYAKGTVDEFCGGMSSLYENMMASMPPEQRAMMEQMMGAKGNSSPPKVKVKRVGSGGTIAGFETEKYEVHVNGSLYEEVWLTTDRALVKEMKPLIPMMKKFSTCQGKMGMAAQNEPESSREYQDFMEKGWEMKSVSHEDAMTESSSEVVRLEKKTVPDADFAPPVGYRKVSFGELMGSQMQME